MTGNLEYKYRGARALVILHEQNLRNFLDVWRRFKASSLPLPSTSDPSYASTEKLLLHVIRAARGYMTWMCEKLELPDPGIRPAPGEDQVESEAEVYLEHVLERWKLPLIDVTEAEADGLAYESRWGVPYSIDAMLEHAAMHPVRHAFQLQELLGQSDSLQDRR